MYTSGIKFGGHVLTLSALPEASSCTGCVQAHIEHRKAPNFFKTHSFSLCVLNKLVQHFKIFDNHVAIFIKLGVSVVRFDSRGIKVLRENTVPSRVLDSLISEWILVSSPILGVPVNELLVNFPSDVKVFEPFRGVKVPTA